MSEALLAYRKALAISEAGEFADIALYRIGRILFDGKEFYNAITSFNQLLSQYPKSTYITDARYKIAEAYFYLANMRRQSVNIKTLYPSIQKIRMSPRPCLRLPNHMKNQKGLMMQ